MELSFEILKLTDNSKLMKYGNLTLNIYSKIMFIIAKTILFLFCMIYFLDFVVYIFRQIKKLTTRQQKKKD